MIERRTEALMVVSDLHLSAVRNEGLFRADRELADFLASLLKTPGMVVLAGDAFDFLYPSVGEPVPSSFDAGNCVRLAKKIVALHDEVFSSLALLCASKHHEVIILAGNHDPELALPEVRAVFEQRCGKGLNWLTGGEALTTKVGGARVLVEHGDASDPWNRVDHNDLGRAVRLASRELSFDYALPPGSRLVNEFVTPMRRTGFSWVELLKPEREAVFPLLAQFMNLRERARFVGVVSPWFEQLRRAAIGTVASADDVYKGEGPGPFARWLEKELDEPAKGEPSFAKRIAELRVVSAEDHYFDVARRDELHAHAAFLASHGFDLVVNGHTHAAKAFADGAFLYLNSGTWAQLLRLPHSTATDAEWTSFLESLKADTAIGEARPTWVFVTRDGSRTTAELREWGKTALSTHHFDGSGWKSA